MLQQIDNATKFYDKGYEWILHEGEPQTEHYQNFNTLHYQVFNTNIPYIIDFAEKTFEKYTCSMIKQEPAKVIPLHTDKYYIFSKKHKCNPDDVTRINIFLEDWKSGHYFELEEKPITNWKKGQYVILNNKIKHRSANVGDQTKYTAQITGILKSL
jgi:hypothetical protein